MRNQALNAADESASKVAFDVKDSLQMLADIRDCFAHHDYTDRLSTSTLLEWLHSRPARPWDVDGPITARRFAHLLVPFDIVPRVQRMAKTSLARGYQLQDFLEHWQKHLGFEVPVNVRNVFVTDATPSEIANKDAAGYAVTDSRALSESRPSADGHLNLSPVACDLSPVSVVTHQQPSEIVNKDAACYAVTDSRTEIGGSHGLQSVVSEARAN